MKTKYLTILLAFLALSTTQTFAQGALRFADVFTDNMVLQRNKEIKVWGWAPAGSRVQVLLTQSQEEAETFAGAKALKRVEEQIKPKPQNPAIGKVHVTYFEEEPAILKTLTKETTAGKDGRWEVTLGKHKASFKPTFLAAKAGEKSVAIKNLLIGEVWIASGQSNMEWAWSRDKMWENEGLIFTGIRYAKVRGASTSPRESFVSNAAVKRGAAFEPWIVCEDGAVGRLATVPYLFAQYLHRRLKVPVGIINIAQGGSFSREWCSRQLLDKMNSPTLNAQLAAYDAKKKEGETEVNWRGGPAELYNARLYPIRKMTVAGVIYMQGENESLCGDLPQYVKTFPGVIKSYRKTLSCPDLPFGIITLQGYGGYTVAREIHLQTHRKTPNTGYIVAHDIGGSIHPTWKRPISERAVYWALRDVYKVLDNVKKTRIKGVDFKGGQAFVSFEQVDLKNGKWTNPKTVMPRTNDQQPYAGFEIAGADRTWYRGRISVSKRGTVGLKISHPLVPKPVALRYAWCGFPCGNLGSWEDPIPPYRSDDWPVVADDIVATNTPGKLSASELNYLKRHEQKNRQLELGLKVPVLDSYDDFTKRYAHPKGMLLATVQNMRGMMKMFDLEACKKRAPELRRHALHRIPCRYWQRDRYTPARRAKWGWLIERVIRLGNLPQIMEQTLEKPEVKSKVVELQKALDLLEAELNTTPAPKPMNMDQMLDIILPIMAKEKERLTKEEGIDMKKYKGELSSDPF